MIIFLSELQKEHLSVLHEHSNEVLVDFCKFAIDYVYNGTHQKKNQLAAEMFQVPIDVLQNVIYALVYLIVEGCKHNLSEQDFKSSLAIAGFSSEKQEILVKLFATKRVELSDALCLLQQRDPCYQDFLWRFEVQVASKSCSEEIKPMVAMDFVLMTPKRFDYINEDKQSNISDMGKENKLSPIKINSSIKEAKAASHCDFIIDHFLLECDLPNLIHLTNKLEQALKESKSHHVRKVQMALQ